MFTQPCFIRENNAKLFNKLADLGYEHRKCIVRPYRDLLVVNNGYYSINFPYGNNDEEFIDCGTNEELFLALAALRDDTDKNQWFTDGSDTFWFVLGDDSSDSTIEYYKKTYNKEIHKATVDELIEHFKDK